MATSTKPVLPAEVILEIVKYCDKNTTSALSQLSKGLHGLLQPEVWRTLVFTAADLELHGRSKESKPHKKTPVRHDVLNYFLGGCGKILCTECPLLGKDGELNHPRAASWQMKLVEELVFDFWQWSKERQDRQWAYDVKDEMVCKSIIESFPNIKRIGWRSHVVPILIAGSKTTLDGVRLKSLEFCFDPLHPALPSVWEMDKSRLKVIRPDPTQFADLAFCMITKLRIGELHACQCPFLVYSVRKMPLRSLVLSVDSGALGLLMDSSKEKYKDQGGNPDSARHPSRLPSALQVFLTELTTPIPGAGENGSPKKFPTTLETLTFKDTAKAAEVDLDLLAKSLVPCKELKTLRLIGFPAGSVDKVLQTIEGMR